MASKHMRVPDHCWSTVKAVVSLATEMLGSGRIANVSDYLAEINGITIRWYREYHAVKAKEVGHE